MRKILLTVAAGILGLSLTSGDADANGPRGNRGPRNAPPARQAYRGTAYQRNFGVRFSAGYYYRGRDHHHWARRVGDPAHRRYQYWDPYVNTYYYWYAPGNCYYPANYCP